MNEDKLLAEIDSLRRRVAELEDTQARLTDAERALPRKRTQTSHVVRDCQRRNLADAP